MGDSSLAGQIFSTVLALLGGYGMAYLKKTGEQDAINDGFDKVVSQTRRTVQASEEVKHLIERMSRQDAVAEEIRRLQQPLIDEANRIIVRISERFQGKFDDHFSAPWIVEEPLTIERLGNKRDTTIYRFLRFFAAYGIYRQATAGLPSCRGDKLARFYIARKIEPVFASGGYPGDPVLWRDTLLESSEQFCVWSEKWKGHRPLSWEEFSDVLSSSSNNNNVLRLSAKRIAERLLQALNPRLALVGVYLIDLVNDIDPPEKNDFLWIHIRQRLIAFLRGGYANKISVYYQENRINDIAMLIGDAPIWPAPQMDRAYPKDDAVATIGHMRSID